MPFTVITKPSVGDPTKKTSFSDAVVDDLNFLYNLLLSTIGSREIITNGSFESDVDVDGIPDNWTRSLYTGGSFSHETSTSAADGKSIHGKRSVKFTSPGGASNGGGYIETTDYFEVSEKRPYLVAFAIKSSAAGIHNVVEVSWYDSTQTLISTSTIYDSTSNPTSWSMFIAACSAPSNGRYAKVKLTGAKDDNTTAGSCWFDDVRIGSINFDTQATFSTPGTCKWVCPSNVRLIEYTVTGGGGGGGGEQGAGAGGGGAGGTAHGFVAVTPGTTYDLVIGAAGTAGDGATPTDGGAGGNSTLTVGATTYTGAGGSGGVRSTGTGNGGAGGAGTNGDTNTSGTAGGNRSGNTGGDGGRTPFGIYAIGGTAIAGTGGAGPHFGAGGGGAGNAGGNNNGGAGAAGAIILRW